jgi:prevent-host-death family protein
MTSCGHKEQEMETMQIREAKASFSSVIAAAEKGHPTIISRHGHPCAMVVPISDGQRLYPLDTPNLATYLLSMPCAIDIQRDDSPLRSIDL